MSESIAVAVFGLPSNVTYSLLKAERSSHRDIHIN